MSIKKNILIPLLITFVCVFAIVLYNNNQIKEINDQNSFNIGEWGKVLAAGGCSPSSHNVTGWAYAYPIGPISLSCTNQNAPVNYGVNIIESFSPVVECLGGIVCDSNYMPTYAESENYHHVRITGTDINGSGSGTFIVPQGLSMLDVTVVGGGAAGFKLGGAGGYVKTEKNYKVIQGESINVVVGAGGTFDPSPYPSNMRKGKSSSFGSVLVNNTAEKSFGLYIKSNGGSGGGGFYIGSGTTPGGEGGSNGGDGQPRSYPGGIGQYSTTKGIDGMTYAAGGGGGGASTQSAYGGTDDFDSTNLGRAATSFNNRGGTPINNSGSGGGAGFYNSSFDEWSEGGDGASGVIIVRFPKLNAKELSGYAWSAAIGPISFNKNEICASSVCKTTDFPANNANTKHVAKIEYVKPGVAKITGWARALAACDFDGQKCTKNTAGANAGGWDGWIKFDKDATINFIKEGSVYNTIIQTDKNDGEHKILGNAWGGDLLDTRTPPSAVLGEIRYINAKTTYDPNRACEAEFTPTANFTLACAEKSVGVTCYFKKGSTITLNNLSSADNSECTFNRIEKSIWTPGGAVALDEGSTFATQDKAQYVQNIKLEVEDSQGKKGSKSEDWTLIRAIQADFSCCVKKEGNNCDEDGDFKKCNDESFKNLTVTEDTILYLRDSTSVPAFTIKASDATNIGRVWTYPQGNVNGSGENINIPIRQGGKIQLKASDTSGDDTMVKDLDGAKGIFGKILKNPDFKEIPFD
ncbi:MAG: hypothetical protein PHU74_00370 [Candidatus Pacebacteria bacterium]|nr:hypothetical protein [Candidatus Paceibacterota bacterium]